MPTVSSALLSGPGCEFLAREPSTRALSSFTCEHTQVSVYKAGARAAPNITCGTPRPLLQASVPAVPLSEQDSAGGRHGLSAPLSALQGPRAELGTPGPCFSSFPGVPCCSDDTRGDFLASSVTAVGFICQWKCSLPFFLALKVLCEIG